MAEYAGTGIAQFGTGRIMYQLVWNGDNVVDPELLGLEYPDLERLFRLKGTRVPVRPDWIYMRVVQLDRP
jgi:hypothetical protein